MKLFSTILGLSSVLLILEANPTIEKVYRPKKGDAPWYSAEEHLDMIFFNEPTERNKEWKSRIGGFEIHIDQKDSIFVYPSNLDLIQLQTQASITIKELEKIVKEVVENRESTEVLLTTAIQLQASKYSQDLLRILYRPEIQIYYINDANKASERNAEHAPRAQHPSS